MSASPSDGGIPSIGTLWLQYEQHLQARIISAGLVGDYATMARDATTISEYREVSQTIPRDGLGNTGQTKRDGFQRICKEIEAAKQASLHSASSASSDTTGGTPDGSSDIPNGFSSIPNGRNGANAVHVFWYMSPGDDTSLWRDYSSFRGWNWKTGICRESYPVVCQGLLARAPEVKESNNQ